MGYLSKNTVHTTKEVRKVRIIAGKYKSRQITFSTVNNKNTRPTTDRLRETLFNWLIPYIIKAKCLDAFAGSGALGFEALSRLAESCDFFEIDNQAIKQLTYCKDKLNADNAFIYQNDVIRYLQNCSNYQVIFLDPPFNSKLLNKALMLILKNTNIGSDTLIYAEYSTKTEVNLLNYFKTIKQTKQGQVTACLLWKKD